MPRSKAREPEAGGADDGLRELRRSEARWRAVLDTARDAIISIDRNGCITLFNRCAEEIFGYQAGEVVGHEVSVLMPSPYREEHERYLRDYERTGERKAIGRIRKVEGRRKDGTVFPIELSVSETRVGDEVLYVAILRDVTERYRAEEELQEAQRLAQQRERLADIGAITANIAHDLGNPLAALSMQLQLVRRQAERDPNAPLSSVLTAAEQLAVAIRRLESLVRDLMSFSREQRLERKTIVPSSFLRDVAAFWAPVAAEHDVGLDVDIRDEAPSFEADEGKLRRVLDNLVKNALEAIDERPARITLRLSTPAREKVRISIEDTGPGIPDGVRVFRLFETTKAHGSGIGLALSRQIIRAHGGEMTYDRLDPRGTAFHVDLPIFPAVQ